ncbi:MAG: hypothetical protein WCK89_11175 [bacterium]
MKQHTRSFFSALWVTGLLSTGLCAAAFSEDAPVLKSKKITASFNPAGLTSIRDLSNNTAYTFKSESSTIQVDDQTIHTAALTPSGMKRGRNAVTYTYQVNSWTLNVVYELQPDWNFISKQLILSRTDGASYRVKTIDAFRGELDEKTAGLFKQAKGNLFLRFGAGDKPACGMLCAVQNFFTKSKYADRIITLAYEPDMEWKSAFGPFESDRACLAVYALSGAEIIKNAPAEWNYLPNPEKTVAEAEKIDLAEVEAYQQLVRSFTLVKPEKSLRIHVGWCVNDYQIDCGTPDGMTEYKRIIDRAAEVGCHYILYAPANSQVSDQKECRDAWGWENLLWLGMGQKIRNNQWDPARDAVPAGIQEMLSYAKARNIKLVAYAYPSMPWMQDLDWTQWCNNKPGGYIQVDTGVRSFQDWFVKKLVAFEKKTGVGGYSFDHWWIAYTNPENSTNKVSSKYAQWYGCRRILTELRKQCPDILVDGRQQYCWFGPWTVVGGTYPHPFGGDEQPGSFRARADLHTDRLSANHIRWVNWRFLMEGFYPVELVPGYMTHQTQRADGKGVMHRDPWRRADWDYLGWRYSVLSSIATAPYNHVLNFMPARDVDEFKAFSKADQQWWRQWLDWTDQNMDVLHNLRILAPPMVGRTDASAAFKDDHGFVFLFNANYRKLNAEFTLDPSIGLNKGEAFVVTQLYPREGMLIGKPGAGIWQAGDKVSLLMDGASAVVLAVNPAPKTGKPVLFNATGTAALRGGRLELKDVRGETGTSCDLVVALPKGSAVTAVTVNGKSAKYSQSGSAVSLNVKFAGAPFSQCQQVGTYSPVFSGETFTGEFSIPKRIFDQLQARKAAWPVPYTEDDRIAPWIGPERLLLFVNIADAKPDMNVTMKLNGQPFDIKKAFNGIYTNSGNQTFIGFYADVASLNPDTPYKVEIGLPPIVAGPVPKPEDGQAPKLSAGQFQGLYFDNVEPEYTHVIGE